EQIGCAYTGGNNCDNIPPNQDPDCVMFCEQFIPPGCDCFGCCEVQTPDGPAPSFLNSGPDCALDNLDAHFGVASAASREALVMAKIVQDLHLWSAGAIGGFLVTAALLWERISGLFG
ncbi:MAG: hypothetical protein ABTQ30_09925, partial [Rhizobiaceae bacterium]